MPENRQAAGRVAMRVLLDGQFVDWHHHDADQLVYPARGVLSVLTDGSTWVVPSPGRGIWVPAGLPHAHRAHGQTSLRTLLLPAETRVSSPGEPRVLTVSALLREVLAVLTGEPDLPRARRDRLLGVALDELTSQPQPALVLPRPKDPRLAAAATALWADPAGASASELAMKAGVSERTLSRLVRQELGLSVPQWRTQHRLAASLLRLTDGATVTAAAHRCGWRSASSYIAAFRATFGMTPRMYQQSL